MYPVLKSAQSQQVKLLELGLPCLLRQLGQRRGQRTEAQQLLTEISGWFTEGFDATIGERRKRGSQSFLTRV